jgi:hypothetical protein
MKTAIGELLEYFIKEQKKGCSHWCIHDLIAQLYVAKEMEKQNIIESYCQGCFDMWKDNGIVPRETAEEYYNKTFKSE